MKMKLTLGAKLATLIVMLALVLSAAAASISYSTYKRSMETHYIAMGQNLVKTLASQVSPEELVRYAQTKTVDEAYTKLQAFILALKENNEVQYLYIVKPDEKGATFLFDSDMQGGTGYTEGGYCALGTYVEFDADFAQQAQSLLRGEPVKPIITHGEYGWLLTVQQPVLTQSGAMAGYVCADIDMTQVVRDRQQFLLLLVVLVAGITALFVFISLVLVRSQVVRPIKAMTQATGQFLASGETGLASPTAQNLHLQTHDELQTLSEAIEKLEQDLISYVEDLTVVTAEKERIGAELNVATQIQASMLPCIFPAFPHRNEFDIFATMQPAKEVGGDFYDFFMVDQTHLAVVIADVSGKGVPAALFMVIGKTLLKDHTQMEPSLGRVFSEVNDLLCESNSEGLFITAFAGVLDIVTGEFVYVNAGHNPPLLRRADANYEYMKVRPGFVLAGMENIQYRAASVVLQPGDSLFLYTDGVTEATNIENELFAEQRLLDALNANQSLGQSLLLPKIKQAVDVFVGEAPQFDDITMLGLSYYGPQTEAQAAE